MMNLRIYFERVLKIIFAEQTAQLEIMSREHGPDRLVEGRAFRQHVV